MDVDTSASSRTAVLKGGSHMHTGITYVYYFGANITYRYHIPVCASVYTRIPGYAQGNAQGQISNMFKLRIPVCGPVRGLVCGTFRVFTRGYRYVTPVCTCKHHISHRRGRVQFTKSSLTRLTVLLV